MKFQRLFPFVFALFLVNPFLCSNKAFADWAYAFVVWDGFIYIVSDEFVEEIDKEIGHVTKYSGKEGTYSGNFSNRFKKGTSYFSIKGISTDEAIAIQDEEGTYIKAVRGGEYAGNKKNFPALMIGFLMLVPIVIFGFIVKKKPSQRHP